MCGTQLLIRKYVKYKFRAARKYIRLGGKSYENYYTDSDKNIIKTIEYYTRMEMGITRRV